MMIINNLVTQLSLNSSFCKTVYECQHWSLGRPSYKKIYGMSPDMVRVYFPRIQGQCPDCLESVILYASFEHYIAGDW